MSSTFRYSRCNYCRTHTVQRVSRATVFDSTSPDVPYIVYDTSCTRCTVPATACVSGADLPALYCATPHTALVTPEILPEGTHEIYRFCDGCTKLSPHIALVSYVPATPVHPIRVRSHISCIKCDYAVISYSAPPEESALLSS